MKCFAERDHFVCTMDIENRAIGCGSVSEYCPRSGYDTITLVTKLADHINIKGSTRVTKILLAR
jgi:hypothetical protein